MSDSSRFDTLLSLLEDRVRGPFVLQCFAQRPPKFTDEEVNALFSSPSRTARVAALKYGRGTSVYPDVVYRAFSDPCQEVRAAAISQCRDANVPAEQVREWARDASVEVREAAVELCKDPEYPADILHNALKDPDPRVRSKAFTQFVFRSDITEAMLLKGFLDPDSSVQFAAAMVGINRNIPLEIFERALDTELADEDNNAKYMLERVVMERKQSMAASA